MNIIFSPGRHVDIYVCIERSELQNLDSLTNSDMLIMEMCQEDQCGREQVAAMTTDTEQRVRPSSQDMWLRAGELQPREGGRWLDDQLTKTDFSEMMGCNCCGADISTK